MTAGRMMTTVSALTLGLAMAGAVPALAQNSAGGTGGNAGTGAAATGQTSNTGQANANAPASGGNTQTGTAGNGSSPMATGQTNNAGGTNSMGQSSMHTGRAHETRTAARHSRGRGVSNANPDAQNGDIARLNDQSLQAAQQGHNFTPSGASM